MIDRNFRDILERHGILDPGYLSSGSDDVDFLVYAVNKFEKEDPRTEDLRECPVCCRVGNEIPTIFRDGLGCSDICRKVARGDLALEGALQIHENLTKK